MIPAGDIEADGIYGVTGEGTFVVHQVGENELGQTVIEWSWRKGSHLAKTSPGSFEWTGFATVLLPTTVKIMSFTKTCS